MTYLTVMCPCWFACSPTTSIFPLALLLSTLLQGHLSNVVFPTHPNNWFSAARFLYFGYELVHDKGLPLDLHQLGSQRRLEGVRLWWTLLWFFEHVYLNCSCSVRAHRRPLLDWRPLSRHIGNWSSCQWKLGRMLVQLVLLFTHQFQRLVFSAQLFECCAPQPGLWLY